MLINNKNRLNYLDSLRGIAVLIVVLYHYYYRFSQEGYYKFQTIVGITDNYLFQFGFYGVHLFFVISGFVISLTLFKSASLTEFAIRRFARLWPAMLLCSILTFIYLKFFGVIFQSSPLNFLPSLTFTDPYLFNRIFINNDFNWMDGAYWSLFVEIRFYILVALIFFFTKRFSKIFLILSYTVYLLNFFIVDERLLFILDFIFFTDYLYLFILGIGFYFLYTGNKNLSSIYILSSIIFFILKNIRIGFNYDYYMFLFIISLFLMLNYSETARVILSKAKLSSIGVASYSFYLIHQNVGVDFNYRFASYYQLNEYAAAIVPLLTLVFICFLSQVIYKYYEYPINKFITK